MGGGRALGECLWGGGGGGLNIFFRGRNAHQAIDKFNHLEKCCPAVPRGWHCRPIGICSKPYSVRIGHRMGQHADEQREMVQDALARVERIACQARAVAEQYERGEWCLNAHIAAAVCSAMLQTQVGIRGVPVSKQVAYSMVSKCFSANGYLVSLFSEHVGLH